MISLRSAMALVGALMVGAPVAMPQHLARAGDRSDVRPVDDAWRLRSVEGDMVRFSSFRGRPIVLNVWATWCAPCVAELGSLQALRDSVRADASDVAFVFLAPETADQVARFARRRRLALPLHVEIDPLPASFGVRALPTTIVLDRTGRVVMHHRGAADWNTPAMRVLLRRLAQ